MKITDFKTFVVGNPPPHRDGGYFTFVKLVTDDNTVGYGETFGVPFHPHTTARMIEDICERYVVGRIHSGPSGCGGSSIRAAIASVRRCRWWGCRAASRWPAGTSSARPVYNLLGGQVHEKLRSYTYVYPAGDAFGDA